MKNQMVRKMIITLAIVMLMGALPIAGYAVDSNTDTQATISFEAGDLEWDTDLPSNMTGMNFNFGEDLPLPAGDSSYTSTDVSHTLRVKDARKVHKPWSMTVSMTSFADTNDGATSFEGTVTLIDPTSTHAELVVENPIEIISMGGSVDVMKNDAPSRDVFDAKWLGTDVELTFSATEAEKITDLPYEATLTWILSTEL